MLKQAKFIPAIATLLCACSVQAVNFHIGFDFPLRPVRPVYPLYTVPVYRVYNVPHVRPCHTAVDMLISEVQRDLHDIHEAVRHSPYADLCRLSHSIKNNWRAWITGYVRAYGINIRDLEIIADEVRTIRFELKRIQRERRSLLEYELRQVRNAMTDLADIFGSVRRYRTSDIHDGIRYLSEIERILTRV